MPPSLALLLWLVLLVGLLWFDPAKGSRISPALWVPVISMFIVGSRNPSQWLGGHVGMAAQALEEGNSLDRTISSALILLAVGILISRSFNWGSFLVRNSALMAFLSFALLSVLWSDFPLVSLKRWFRDVGNYIVILVVLSDPRPLEAIRTVLRRLSYFLLPLSVVLVKYYPELGKSYDPWTGIADYSGVTTSKNMLGVVCLISGLFFFWDTMTRWPERKQRRTKRILLLNVAFIVMTLWLLNIAHSTTSSVCLLLGCLVISAAHTRVVKRRPVLLKVLVPACFILYLILSLGFDMNGAMAGAVGKDPTLTDRTKIWAFVLGMHTNPLVGTGYESFWLGPRLERFWLESGLGHINEAHNGYLEVYLNLGLIGVFLLGGFMIASYRTISRRLRPLSSLASLTLALWVIILFYSVTEVGFRAGLMWFAFLLGGMAAPERAPAPVQRVSSFDDTRVSDQLPNLSLEMTGQRDNHGYAHPAS
jgi:exopolysaccharide production protein ExoQ